jgi:hypothetical protein
MGRQAAVCPVGHRRAEPPSGSVAGSRSVAEILARHVTLELSGIDRMYLNAYIPRLQTEAGVAAFLVKHRGHRVASSVLLDPISKAFVARLERFAREQGIDLVTFQKGQRKDDVAAEYRQRFAQAEGVLFLGKAQEKVRVVRTQRRRNPQTGATYPWLVASTALVNQYYIYAVDKDFGPFFLKFSSYFPYNAKLCLNGHEYLKRQLLQRGIEHEALDNGVLSCADPKAAQKICDSLSAQLIERFFRKWLALVPHPFDTADRRAGYRYELSILQIELSLTQVLDRPLSGRILFEEILRENLDLGRPDQVQILFARRVTRRTPGRFRTRVLTEGVQPSLHIDYRKSKIKQYHKQGRALRTETTINDTRDFAIGRRLRNLAALRKIGFEANRRLLDVQRLSHDATLGEDEWYRVVHPVEVEGRHASALRFDDARVQALFAALILFVFQLRGFSSRDLREPLAHLLGLRPDQLTAGRMTYDLRRLRLHGLIERLPKSHRYQLTPRGRSTAIFFNRVYARLLRPQLATLCPQAPPGTSPLAVAFRRLDGAIDQAMADLRLAG